MFDAYRNADPVLVVTWSFLSWFAVFLLAAACLGVFYTHVAKPWLVARKERRAEQEHKRFMETLRNLPEYRELQAKAEARLERVLNARKERERSEQAARQAAVAPAHNASARTSGIDPGVFPTPGTTGPLVTIYPREPAPRQYPTHDSGVDVGMAVSGGIGVLAGLGLATALQDNTPASEAATDAAKRRREDSAPTSLPADEALYPAVSASSDAAGSGCGNYSPPDTSSSYTPPSYTPSDSGSSYTPSCTSSYDSGSSWGSGSDSSCSGSYD